jgi:hypothetical protein
MVDDDKNEQRSPNKYHEWSPSTDTVRKLTPLRRPLSAPSPLTIQQGIALRDAVGLVHVRIAVGRRLDGKVEANRVSVCHLQRPTSISKLYSSLLSPLHQRSRHERERHTNHSRHLRIPRPAPSLSSPTTMIYSPFNIAEEIRVFLLRIVLSLLCICIGELFRRLAPPPRVIVHRLLQFVLAVRPLFGIVSFFCEGAVVLLAMFD